MGRNLAVIALSLVWLPASWAADSMFKVNPSILRAVNRTDDRYQSYNIEMAEVIGGRFWRPYQHFTGVPSASDAPEVGGENALFEARSPIDLSNPRLRVLAAALGPTYVRVSGTWANSVFLQRQGAAPPESPPQGYKGVLTRDEWRGVIEFAKAVDAHLVTSFTISDGVRDAQGNWSPVEAQSLVDLTHEFGGDIVAAEFFNEPNVASHGAAPAHYDAPWFARDEEAFRRFVAVSAPGMRILGPGSSVLVNMNLPGELKTSDLLSSEPRPRFDIYSYHFYGAVSQRCAPAGSPMGISEDEALSEDWLARTDQAFDSQRVLRDQYAPGAPIWLTETAEAACGGDPWATGFADSFRYLDQMARLAKRGVSVVFHNTLAASEYGLIDQSTLEPRPNYWAALLWRRLMGAVVLDVGSPPPNVHLYAHCLRGATSGVALLALNLSDAPVSLSVDGAQRGAFALTAVSLQDQHVLLNGQPLALTAEGKLPELKPTRLRDHQIRLAPHSIEFISVAGARNASCR